MIATDRFVYIHLHKSGGTFVNEALLRFIPGASMFGYHLPRSRIPQSMQDLPVLGFVRSPWSYYVSWYSFQAQMAQPNALFGWASENRTLDFAGTLRNLLDLGRDTQKLDSLLKKLPADYTNRGLNLPSFALEPIRDSGKGFYSFLYDYMYAGGSTPSRVGRTEHLREDLFEMLDAVRQPVTHELCEFIARASPRNPSSHANWRNYYDAELATLVAERDGSIIKTHDYRFEN